MITKLLVILIVTSVTLSREKNVRVNGFGRPAYVDPEKLLEGALSSVFTPTRGAGILKVDVDDRKAEGAYDVSIYATEDLGPNFTDELQKVLRSELNFVDAEVRNPEVKRTKFRVYLNPMTYRSNMESIAEEVVKSRRIKLRRSEYDD